jgi:tRNA 2-selenouridine synthase
MAEYKLNITEFLAKSNDIPVIDVRSPAEFDHGHIPGAVNLPLFTNEERSIVGTLYLQKGSSDAMMKGLEMIGPKMKEFAARATGIAPGGESLLHCWRGGMRSNSMAWLLNTVGIKTHTLEGGYKSYRRFALAFFTRPVNLVVIGGMTGSGKTEVLEALESRGIQVILLEQLARHKGSVFGNIGMPSQSTTEQFENDLFTCLMQLNPDEPVYIEDESLAIGRVFIPVPFYEQMSSSRFLSLVVPLNRRIQRLVEAYTGGDKESLIEGVERIEKRLGLENAANAINCIKKGDMQNAVEIVLRYYDKIYARSMGLHKRKESLEIRVNNENSDEIANKIITSHQKHNVNNKTNPIQSRSWLWLQDLTG